jgi:hypothetical protein
VADPADADDQKTNDEGDELRPQRKEPAKKLATGRRLA